MSLRLARLATACVLPIWIVGHAVSEPLYDTYPEPGAGLYYSSSSSINTDMPRIAPWGYPLDAFDTDIDPGDDFFEYANGSWLAVAEIPSDRTGTGYSLDMRKRNDARIAKIIADLSVSEQEDGEEGQKIRDLYQSFMNYDRIEALGMKAVAPDLVRIRDADTHYDIAKLFGDPSLKLSGPFNFYVGVDPKAPSKYIVKTTHSGLGLPDKSYYERASRRLEVKREAYKDFMCDMLEIAGARDNVEARVAAVYALEERIAALHWTRSERRDATRTNNRMSVSTLAGLAPEYPWQTVLEAQGLPVDGTIIVRELDAYPKLAELFAETPISVWQDYIRIQYLTANASYLPDHVFMTSFRFHDQILRGQSEPRSREQRALALTNNLFDHAIGKEYVERYFPAESKLMMEDMFEHIRAALSLRIDNLEWMTAPTKEKAQKKLAAMTAKIGYPDQWLDYSELKMSPHDLLGNVKAYRRWDKKRENESLNKTVDETEWTRAPQTINAFYSPSRNEAFIPAGYIQSPLFDPAADAAINYGAIGSIIGHEIGHGFDDQGSKYDHNGKLRSWWTEEDRAAFDELGDRLAEQFSEYQPLPGLHLNGRQTLGENIGDLAGVLVAYHAYRLHLNGEPSPVLDGFTGEQRVFLGRAQARRYKRTEESLRRRVLSASHSPMKVRVNGMVRNIDEWYEAFNVQPGDAMYLPPEQRIRIW